MTAPGAVSRTFCIEARSMPLDPAAGKMRAAFYFHVLLLTWSNNFEKKHQWGCSWSRFASRALLVMSQGYWSMGTAENERVKSRM